MIQDLDEALDESDGADFGTILEARFAKPTKADLLIELSTDEIEIVADEVRKARFDVARKV